MSGDRNVSRVAAALVALGVLGACMSSRRAADLDLEVATARGGRLYDKWFAETGAEVPATVHPLYPADGPQAGSAASTWRCKECHGWDYMGRDGAYASGSHATGIPGIRAAAGGDVADIARSLADGPHGYRGLLSDEDLHAVALFVSRGQVDMDAVIDRGTRTPRGDADRGSAHYATLCAGCHGPDGRHVDMPELGPLARKNPWETLHKVLNGQPDCAMPALRTLDRDVSLDIVRFTQTLPGEE